MKVPLNYMSAVNGPQLQPWIILIKTQYHLFVKVNSRKFNVRLIGTMMLQVHVEISANTYRFSCVLFHLVFQWTYAVPVEIYAKNQKRTSNNWRHNVSPQKLRIYPWMQVFCGLIFRFRNGKMNLKHSGVFKIRFQYSVIKIV